MEQRARREHTTVKVERAGHRTDTLKKLASHTLKAILAKGASQTSTITCTNGAS